MGRSIALATLIAGALAGGCGTPGGSTAAPDGALDVRTSLDVPTLRPRRGDLATLILTIRNASPNPLVLRDLTQPKDLIHDVPAGAVVTWQFSQPGLLSYHPDRDEWLHERARRSDARRPVFNSGLLVPGETITVRARIRLLHLPLDFRFTYFELSPDEVRRKVYWEERKDKESRFRTLVGQELERRLQPDPRTDAGGRRIVLFPHAEPLKTTAALLKTVRVDTLLEARDFDLTDALDKAGVPEAPERLATFCSALDAWIIPKAGGHVLVTPKGVSLLPKLVDPERVAYFIDTISPQKVQIELKGDAVAGAMQERRYTLVAQERRVAIGAGVSETIREHFTFVSPPDLPRLLSDARELKLTLGAAYGSEQSGRLVLDYR